MKKTSVKNSASKKERTRRRIINAARKIISRKGFEATNVSDIVRKVNVAQGTFYYHFPDMPVYSLLIFPYE